MRVTIVCPVFPPEPIVSASTTFDIARALVQNGHQVTVITAYPSRPAGRIYEGYRRRLLEVKDHPEGFRIVRCGSSISRKPSFLSRGAQNITFGLLSAVAQVIYGRADVVYVITWPLFARGCTALTARMFRTPFLLSEQDIYPESLLARSRVDRNSLLYRVMLAVDGGVARLAARVVVLTEALAEEYQSSRRLAGGVVHRVPNWTQVPDPCEEEVGLNYRRRHNIPESAFVIAYAGTFAESAGVDQLIRALALLSIDREMVLLLAGDGACFEGCRAMAGNVPGLRVVLHRPYHPKDASGVLGAADVLVVPTRGQISLTALPSKLMHYMFAARPVLAACNPNSELAHIVAASGCGWVAEPDNAPALAQLLQLIIHAPHESLRRMGENGCDYARRHFSPEACLPKVIRLIEDSGTRPLKLRARTGHGEQWDERT